MHSPRHGPSRGTFPRCPPLSPAGPGITPATSYPCRAPTGTSGRQDAHPATLAPAGGCFSLASWSDAPYPVCADGGICRHFDPCLDQPPRPVQATPRFRVSWSQRGDLNPGKRFCRPPPCHSATSAQVHSIQLVTFSPYRLRCTSRLRYQMTSGTEHRGPSHPAIRPRAARSRPPHRWAGGSSSGCATYSPYGTVALPGRGCLDVSLRRVICAATCHRPPEQAR